jgi:hypothetical protein
VYGPSLKYKPFCKSTALNNKKRRNAGFILEEHCLLVHGFSPKLGFFADFLYISLYIMNRRPAKLRLGGVRGGGLLVNEPKETGRRSAAKTHLYIHITWLSILSLVVSGTAICRPKESLPILPFPNHRMPSPPFLNDLLSGLITWHLTVSLSISARPYCGIPFSSFISFRLAVFPVLSGYFLHLAENKERCAFLSILVFAEI